jgi:DNA polymerase III alpha subunit (gram-positive type)
MKAKNFMPSKGICIDVETSGTNPHKHQIVSIGAAIFDTNSFEIIDVLYVELKPDADYEWSKAAENVHGLTRDYLEANGVSQEEAVTLLGSLIYEHIGTGKVMLSAHHANFDKSFIDALFEKFYMTINWHHVILDMAPIYAAMCGIYTSDDIFEMNGFDIRGDHNSLDDVVMTITSIKNLKQLLGG